MISLGGVLTYPLKIDDSFSSRERSRSVVWMEKDWIFVFSSSHQVTMTQDKDSGNGEAVKVYLRFRPMSRLETSKRAKDCIHLHDNPTIVTVNSPLEGVYDFSFDMVRSS